MDQMDQVNFSLEQANFEVEKHKLRAETLQNKLDQQRIKARNLQLNLAGKIVVLEEQIEKMNNEREDHQKQLEQAHLEEIQKTTQGVE